MAAERSHGAVEVRFENVALKRGPRQVLSGIDLDVMSGETLALVGPSGAGKSSLLKLINRMLMPDAGTVTVRGRPTASWDPFELRRSTGYVIQEIGLFPHLTVAENVGVVPRLLGWDEPRISRRTAEMLTLVGLDPARYAARPPAELSGGERQRVGVARALAADPPLLLMDEPFGAIDPINRERLQNEFLRLQAEIRKTIVFVTHDIDEAIKMGDRIAVLKEGGHLAQYAPPAELLMAPADEFVEQFVGDDRALKRLALQRVRDVDLIKVANIRPGEPVAEARAKCDDSDVDLAMLIDDEGRPQGWLSERAFTGERVRKELRSPAEPIIDLDDVLRDALGRLLAAESRYGPVVDARGRMAGVLSMDVISHSLQVPAEETRTGADLVADE